MKKMKVFITSVLLSSALSITALAGEWYYLNPTGEMRYDDLTENGITYHFDSNGYCTNPNNESSFDSDYQSILNQEQLEAQKRLLDQGTSTGNAYEENIVYEHDVAPQPIKNRFPLADMQL